MPICEEPVERVFAGLKAIYQSLERTGALPHFDFFILSDSINPDTYVREEAAGRAGAARSAASAASSTAAAASACAARAATSPTSAGAGARSTAT